MLEGPEEDPSNLQSLTHVGITMMAGAIAGSLHQYTTILLESEVVRDTTLSPLKRLQQASRGSLVLMTRAMLPSVVGFLAFEYGKEVLDKEYIP